MVPLVRLPDLFAAAAKADDDTRVRRERQPALSIRDEAQPAANGPHFNGAFPVPFKAARQSLAVGDRIEIEKVKPIAITTRLDLPPANDRLPVGLRR